MAFNGNVGGYSKSKHLTFSLVISTDKGRSSSDESSSSSSSCSKSLTRPYQGMPSHLMITKLPLCRFPCHSRSLAATTFCPPSAHSTSTSALGSMVCELKKERKGKHIILAMIIKMSEQKLFTIKCHSYNSTMLH